MKKWATGVTKNNIFSSPTNSKPFCRKSLLALRKISYCATNSVKARTAHRLKRTNFSKYVAPCC